MLLQAGGPVLLFLDDFLKSLVVVEDGLGELKEMPQQIFGAEELDPQLPWPQMNPGRQIVEAAVPDIGGGGDLDLFAGRELAHPVELFGEAHAAQVLSAELFSLTNGLQLRYQLLPVDEEGFPCLEAPELAEERDGAAAADVERFLHDRAVDNGAGKGAEFR